MRRLLALLLLAAPALGQGTGVWHGQGATDLQTTGAPVNVSAAAPPSGAGKACVTTDATHCTWQTVGFGSGSVTSVGNGTIGSLFSASWATATTTPALSLNLAAQSSNCVIASPANGSSGVPTCRALVAADVSFLPAPAGPTGAVQTNGGSGAFGGSSAFTFLSSVLAVPGTSTGVLTPNGSQARAYVGNILAVGDQCAAFVNSGGTLVGETIPSGANGVCLSADNASFGVLYLDSSKAIFSSNDGYLAMGDNGVHLSALETDGGFLYVGGTGGEISLNSSSQPRTAIIYRAASDRVDIGNDLEVDNSLRVDGLTGSGTVLATLDSSGIFGRSSVSPYLTGVTGSISGALTLGTCDSGTATVTGATTGMTAVASPTTYPGDLTVWKAYVSSADTVTVKECGLGVVTPTATTYQVRVIQ